MFFEHIFYLFSQIGRFVMLKQKSKFECKNQLIVKHFEEDKDYD